MTGFPGFSHRVLTGDGSDQCFACGTHVDNGWSETGDERADTGPAFASVDCIATDHPPYLLADGTVETCAAHPYECDGPIVSPEHGPNDPTECCGVRFIDPCASWCVNAY